MNFDQSAFLNNSPDLIKMRKSQNTLIITGMGVLLFGIWNVIKTVGIIFLNRSNVVQALREEMDNYSGEEIFEFSDNVIFFFFLFVMAIYLFFGIVTRMIVGFSAISEGKNKHHRNLYLPICILLILGSIFEIVQTVIYYMDETYDNLYADAENSPTVTILIEIKYIIIIIEMLVAAFRVRYFQKNLELLKEQQEPIEKTDSQNAAFNKSEADETISNKTKTENLAITKTETENIEIRIDDLKQTEPELEKIDINEKNNKESINESELTEET